jgi:hypothetical protein
MTKVRVRVNMLVGIVCICISFVFSIFRIIFTCLIANFNCKF